LRRFLEHGLIDLNASRTFDDFSSFSFGYQLKKTLKRKVFDSSAIIQRTVKRSYKCISPNDLDTHLHSHTHTLRLKHTLTHILTHLHTHTITHSLTHIHTRMRFFKVELLPPPAHQEQSHLSSQCGASED